MTSQTTTGVVISEDGYIISSVFGFVSKPTAIFVEDAKNGRAAAKLIATDHLKKLVLLKCAEGQYQPAKFSKNRWPDVGAYSIAAGRLYPGDLPSASVGVISANRRIHGMAIQTDAKISPVNYGGPILDLNGTVMGILVPLSPRETGQGINAGVEWYDSGIGFAIPAADINSIAGQLSRGRDRNRGLLGIALSTSNPLAEEFEIATVHPDSPASKAGLKPGDRIESADGRTVSRYGIFESIIKSAYANEPLQLAILRGKEKLDTELILAEQLAQPKPGYLGMVVGKGVSDDNFRGVRVSVMPGSPLESATSLSELIVTEVNDVPQTSPRLLLQSLRNVADQAEVRLQFAEDSGGQTTDVIVVASPPPGVLADLDTEFMTRTLEANPDGTWIREEKTLPEAGGQLWMYAPEDNSVRNLGVAVLLSETRTPTESVLNRWKDLCKRQNLMLVVPSNPESRPLGREDQELVVAAYKLATTARLIDRNRILLITGKQQVDLCTELLLNPALKQITSAAFIECWPRVTGIPTQAISEKFIRILIVNGVIQSRSDLAIRGAAISHISEGGGTVVQSQAGENDTVESDIARWAFSLTAR